MNVGQLLRMPWNKQVNSKCQVIQQKPIPHDSHLENDCPARTMEDWRQGQYRGGHISWCPSHLGPTFAQGHPFSAHIHPPNISLPAFFRNLFFTRLQAAVKNGGWAMLAWLKRVQAKMMATPQALFLLSSITKDLRKVICLRNNKASLADKKRAFYLQDMFRFTAYLLL